MKLTGETKLFIGIIVATLVIVVAGIFFLSKPTAVVPREELLPQTIYIKGNKDANVYLVEFSDFQCPACKAYQPTIKTIVDKYKDKLVFGYRHFPLDQHPFAQKAALAAEAAGVQGKFWEMHDLLFENQEKFSDSIFAELANQLNLDKEKFATASNDTKLKEKIFADQTYGQKAGVDATPTFFLSGKKLNLVSTNDLIQQIEAAITASQ